MGIEQTKLDEIGIGNKQAAITAKPVHVMGYEIVDVEKEGKAIGKKLVLRVEHPDLESLEISKVKYESHEKLKEAGLWITQDKDGKLPYNSATANLLRAYGCPTIKDMIGKVVTTITDENGYLIAKAY